MHNLPKAKEARARMSDEAKGSPCSSHRLECLLAKIREFVAERDWEQYHSPKNLSTALAVEAAEGRFVLGSIGPAGKPIEPIGSIPRDEYAECVREQARAAEQLVEARRSAAKLRLDDGRATGSEAGRQRLRLADCFAPRLSP